MTTRTSGVGSAAGKLDVRLAATGGAPRFFTTGGGAFFLDTTGGAALASLSAIVAVCPLPDLARAFECRPCPSKASHSQQLDKSSAPATCQLYTRTPRNKKGTLNVTSRHGLRLGPGGRWCRWLGSHFQDLTLSCKNT